MDTRQVSRTQAVVACKTDAGNAQTTAAPFFSHARLQSHFLRERGAWTNTTTCRRSALHVNRSGDKTTKKTCTQVRHALDAFHGSQHLRHSQRSSCLRNGAEATTLHLSQDKCAAHSTAVGYMCTGACAHTQTHRHMHAHTCKNTYALRHSEHLTTH